MKVYPLAKKAFFIHFLIGYFLVMSLTCPAQKADEPFAHTYSIVARDAQTVELAVGVQSHWFSVGSVVSWGEAGVGVIATQSFVNKSFGIRGLDLLKQGYTPEEALKILLSEDENSNVRQVSILSTHGNVATHTGEKCIRYAGHITGTDFSVQANMMLTDKVWPAMAKAFENNAHLPLPEKVIAVMEAAEAAGGDIRGRQSASMLVVKGTASSEPWNDVVMDLRVDDHKEPLKELDRLLMVYRAYDHMNRGDLQMENGNMKEALYEYNNAQKMLPKNIEMKYWHAITLANNGEIDAAINILKKVYKEDKNWKTLTERLPEADLLNIPENDLNKILNIK